MATVILSRYFPFEEKVLKLKQNTEILWRRGNVKNSSYSKCFYSSYLETFKNISLSVSLITISVLYWSFLVSSDCLSIRITFIHRNKREKTYTYTHTLTHKDTHTQTYTQTYIYVQKVLSFSLKKSYSWIYL